MILKGCPGSGKTTWAKKFLEKNKDFVRINRDDLRRTLFPSTKYPYYIAGNKTEKHVTDHIADLTRNLANQGVSIIDDNTNLNPKYFQKSLDFINSLGYNVEIKEFFDFPLDNLLQRNLEREFSVPEDVVYRMYRTQMEIQNRVMTKVQGLPSCVIIDIDGTVADMGKDEPWGRKPYEWSKVINDRPKTNVCNFVKYLISNRCCSYKNPIPIFLSGRDGVAYEDTKEWIYQHLFPGYVSRDSVLLFMRDANDNRHDSIIKEELLRKYILPKYNIDFCLEDRRRVYVHYRALGLEVWAVENGLY